MKLYIKFVAIFLFLSITQGVIYSQATLKTDLNPKETKIFNEAKVAAQNGKIKDSNKKYEQLLKLKPNFVEGILRLGSNYFQEKNFQQSEELFLKAIAIDPNFDPEMYFSLANVQVSLGKRLDAADHFDIYTKQATAKPDKVKKATKLRDDLRFIDHEMKHPKPFEPKNLGPNVNTKYSEYSPSLSIDGSSMIFTRNLGQEDFYLSKIDSFGSFQEASPIFTLNTSQNEGAHAMSADGKFFVFTACDRRDAFGSCDLYYSVLENGKWTIPVNMGHKVNSAAWDSQPTLSPDGRTLYFTSTRLGSLGGSDIWMTYRDKKNAWVTPINLGPTINSQGNDESPFLHADGHTLYFRSNGRIGMGDFDIYYSRKNDTTQVWETPVNIGYPINTEGSEGSMVVSLDGQKAYFASDRDYQTGQKTNHLDLQVFDLYPEARPRPTTFIKGYITDIVTKLPLQVTAKIIDVSTGLVAFSVVTDKDGYFIGSVTVGKNYICSVENKDYIYFAENIDLSEVKILSKPYILHIELTPIPKVEVNTKIDSKPVTLHNIFFASGSAELLPESNTELELLYQLLASNPSLKIKIVGHTDNVGQEDDNLRLSMARAKSVISALKAKGIDESRMTAEGLGESNPIDSNETEVGRKNNRRIEFILI